MYKATNPKPLLIAVLLALTCMVNAQISIQKLQVDYQTTPMGIDIDTPLFSWQMKAQDNSRGQEQTAISNHGNR